MPTTRTTHPQMQSPEFLAFLETYTFEQYVADGKIGPWAAFEKARAEAAA